MLKIRCFLLYLMLIFCMTSCASVKGLFFPDYSVSFDKTLEQVQADSALMEKNKTYQKSFDAKDKMGNWHHVIICDDEYLKIDSVYYAYKFHHLMYYSLTLNVFGDVRSVDGFEKVCGIQGYATAVNNPETTISFIFAKDLYPQKGYSSMYEASRINGIYFTGLNSNEGYIDDFGLWKTYSWKDYYENIFNTMNKDVKKKMFIAISASD